MACPTCVKLKKAELRRSEEEVEYFCSQDCFKASWADHKKKHKPWQMRIESATQVPAEYRGYSDWTGSLRPAARLTPEPSLRAKEIPAKIAKPDYWRAGDPISEKESKRTPGIKIYSPEEIAGIRKACQVGREVLDACGSAVKAGVSTSYLDDVCFKACIDRGAYPSPLNYYNFPCSVCTSVNEVICHGIPDARLLETGDLVNVDVSVYVDGYHGDLNETYIVGEADEAALHLVETAFLCLQAGAACIKPGAMYRDVGNAVDKVARTKNCSVVRTYCGHGIGDLFHTAPNVPHYAKNKSPGVMKPGHIFTIEPMINLGSWRDKTWPDNWTAVTIDGKRSAQFEHTFLVTEDGYEILTMRPNESRMTWDLSKQQR